MRVLRKFMNTKCQIKLDKIIAKKAESGLKIWVSNFLVAAEDARAPRL